MLPPPTLLVAYGVLGVASGLGVLWRRYAMKREEHRLGRRAVLTGAGRALGLETVEAEAEVSDALAGRIDGFAVYVDIGASGRTADRILGARVRVEHRGVPKDLVVLPKHPRPSATAADATSARALEAEVKLEGDPLLLHALFDDAERLTLMRGVAAQQVSITGGVVARGVQGTQLDQAALVGLIEETLALARLVCLERDVVGERLATMAAKDRSPVMRRRALELLVAVFPGSARATEACRRALSDDDEEVRVEGARHLGAEGLAIVRAVASSERARPELRALALAHLAAETPTEVGPILVAALGSSSPVVLAKVLELLGTKALDGLVEVGLEPQLVKLVAHDDDPTAIAAIEVLGRRGTAAAVAPLLELTKGLFRSRARAERAQAAVDWIQDRIGEVEHGALALVDPTGGAGELSIAADEGSLSIPGEGGELALLPASSSPPRPPRV